jgi:hypothetical protein
MKIAPAARGLSRERETLPPYTPLTMLRAWQDTIRKKYRGSGRSKVLRGTLAEAVEPMGRSRAAPRELERTPSRAARVGAALWRSPPASASARRCPESHRTLDTGKVAPKTIRNRLWSLKRLYKILDGPDAETPVDHVEPPAKVRHVITPVAR